MVARAADAVPNTTLYNLRDGAGQTQQDLADAINRLGQARGQAYAVTANQVSRWELGVTFPSAAYRQLLAEHFGVSLQELGLTRPRVAPHPAPARFDEGEVFAIHTDVADTTTSRVQENQAEWREVRRRLNVYRVPLAREAARLYDAPFRAGRVERHGAPRVRPRDGAGDGPRRWLGDGELHGER